ncbi:hypothetical protein JHK86_016929 [Glycine max]|nr:hypothetical protein JHK86_016929 [Glycine max]
MAELMAILHGLRHDLYFSMEGHHRSKAQGQAGLYSMTMPNAIGNDVIAEKWLETHGPGDRTVLTQGLMMWTTCTWTERPYEASLFSGIGFGIFQCNLGGGQRRPPSGGQSHK